MSNPQQPNLAPRVKRVEVTNLKASDAEQGVFTGIASAVGVLDAHNEVIEAGAFDGNDLAKTYPLLWQHDTRNPVGVVKFAVDARGDLIVEKGEINLDTQQGREAHSLMKQGAITKMSIGFNIPQGALKWDEEANIVRILSVDLWEVSLVTFAANPGADILDVKDAALAEAERLKAGKVLSAANRAKVADAITALQAVLDAADAEKEAGDALGHHPAPTGITDLDALKSFISQITTQE